jgi:hypothetical protein
MDAVKTLAPLKLTCTSTACLLGEHYYGPKKRKRSVYPVGACRTCGVDLVDWPRVHGNANADVEYTFSMLKTECWRHHWWHCTFDEKAMRHARKKGKAALALDIDRRLKTKAFRSKGIFDGQQTPKIGNVLFYAQHATATCCRDCIQYWHGISPERSFSEEERAYLSSLVLRFVDTRLPDLPEEGSMVRRWSKS